MLGFWVQQQVNLGGDGEELGSSMHSIGLPAVWMWSRPRGEQQKTDSLGFVEVAGRDELVRYPDD